jgi:hypothetical protein
MLITIGNESLQIWKFAVVPTREEGLTASANNDDKLHLSLREIHDALKASIWLT